jgi:hypothetical protein
LRQVGQTGFEIAFQPCRNHTLVSISEAQAKPADG